MKNQTTIDFDVLSHSREFAEFSIIIKNLTGLAMAINTPDAAKTKGSFIKTQNSPLCKLITSKPEGLARCNECNRKFYSRAAGLGRPLSYKCHAGLVDMAIPVFVQGKHVATISCGQILPSPPGETGEKRILKRLEWLGIPEQRIRNAYYKAPYLPKKTIRNVMSLQSIFARHLCESARKFRELTASLERDEVRRAREYMGENFRNRNLQFSEVADYAGLSPAHFSVVFRKATGVHYSRYLQDLRVGEARRLLSETEKSISEICYECGFNSLTHLNRVFRSIEHCCPSRYRSHSLKEKPVPV